MVFPAAPTVVSAAPAEELTAAGGGLLWQGHLGTAVALFFPHDRAIDNTWMADINYNFNVMRDLSVELGAGLITTDVTDPGFSGDMQMVPLTVGIQYGKPLFPPDGRAYGGMGLGWVMNDLSVTGGISADDSLLVYFMGGVDIPMKTAGVDMALDIELRYQMANADLSNGDTLDLDAFMFRVNLVWLF